VSNQCIEIHDCVLDRILTSNGVTELYFASVDVHQSQGKPGVDPGIGWFQEAILRIFDVQAPPALPKLPIDLPNGQTVLGERISDNEIPLPLDYRGKFELRLNPAQNPGEILLFVGSGAEITLLGEPEEAENFRPK